jgi:hypothetical protein
MNLSSDCFDLILVGTPQFWQMGGVGPLYLQVSGLSGFIGDIPDISDAVLTRKPLKKFLGDHDGARLVAQFPSGAS